jgi:hypothetical protein
MKTLTLAILIFVVSLSHIFATAQAPDRIFYDGKEYSLHTNPMESYFARYPEKRPVTLAKSSGLWRGYVATFVFEMNVLFLEDIEIETMGGKYDDSWKSVRGQIIPKDEELMIDWFTGILILPYGELVKYVHGGYESTYSNYILLEINRGILTDKRTFDHKQYDEFKERQFQAYKKTEAYRKRVADEAAEYSREISDYYLRSHIMDYVYEFLDNEEGIPIEQIEATQ